MTTAEIAECGFQTEPTLTDVRQEFALKISECWDKQEGEWEKLTPSALINRAEKIAVARQLTNDLPDMLNQGEMEYLLRFKDPLAVATDLWVGSIFTEIGEKEFRELLFESHDRRDLDTEYELTEAAAAVKEKTGKARRTAQQKRHSPER